MKITKEQKAESIKILRASLRPKTSKREGTQIFCILRHCSRSGMQRTIQLVTFPKGSPYFLGWHAARVMGWSWDDKRNGIRVNGCGMDMGFHTVYCLGQTLFRDGYKLPSARWL